MTQLDAEARAHLATLAPEMQNGFEERRVSPSPEEVAQLADLMWADATLGPAFRRMGVHGDMEMPQRWSLRPPYDVDRLGTEWQRAWDLVEDFRVGKRWGLESLDLWLATGLCRMRGEGLIDDFRSAEAFAFVEDRRMLPLSATNYSRQKRHGLPDVIDFARALLADPAIVEMFRRR